MRLLLPQSFTGELAMLLLEAQRDPSTTSAARGQIIDSINEKVLPLHGSLPDVLQQSA